MNSGNFSGRPSGFLLGRELLIVVVIVFSSLSFSLGYFVGRSSERKPESTLQPADISEGRQQDLKDTSILAPQAPALPLNTGMTVQPQTKEPVISAAQAQAPRVLEQKETYAPGEDLPKERTSEKSSRLAVAAVLPKKKDQGYTVQLGAFRNNAEAKQLKEKFDKKGYKTYISAVKGGKSTRIYKVKTGDFSEKKRAEILAMKLKKTEGLRAYVTTKAE
jgi:cell division septation protein DedD